MEGEKKKAQQLVFKFELKFHIVSKNTEHLFFKQKLMPKIDHTGDANKLANTTGLKPDYAARCFKANNNDYITSLASFVQAEPKIPSEAFSSTSKKSDNARSINETLRTAYELVQKVSENARVDVKVAWKACANSQWAGQKQAIEAASKLLTSSSTNNASSSNNTAASSSSKYAKSNSERFTGSFFDMDGFFESEVTANCTLVTMNQGFLEKNRHTLRARLLKWVDKVPSFHKGDLPFSRITNPDENTVRVMILDAVRTFLEEKHRPKLTEFIFMFAEELKSYGQAMCYLASICLLVLTEK